MQFFELMTNYQRAKRILKQAGKPIDSDQVRWYRDIQNNRVVNGFMKAASPKGRDGNNRLAIHSEMNWIRTGEPYFKVFPHIASMMSDVCHSVSKLRPKRFL